MTFKKKQLSEIEYVEKIRKRDFTRRRFQWIWPILMVLFFLCLFQYCQIISRISNPLEDDKNMIGLGIGFSFGLALNSIAVHFGMSLKHWIDARKGYRTERLLLKYYDAMQGENAAE